MALLPIRSRILQYLSTVEEANISQVQKTIEPEYGGERQFTWKALSNHLMNLKENELVEEIGYEICGENLEISYAITAYGRNTVTKYLSKRVAGQT